ncbi:Negative regulator of mitotic exit, partial [Tulasnella sp. 418]
MAHLRLLQTPPFHTLFVEGFTPSSDSRYYMFPNMGPAQSGRSGHGSRAFVLGGNSFTQLTPDGPSIVHVFDSHKSSFSAVEGYYSNVWNEGHIQ